MVWRFKLTSRSIFVSLLFIIPLISGLVFFHDSQVAQAQTQESLQFIPQVTLPVPGADFISGTSTPVGEYKNDYMSSNLLARYIKAIYDYGLMICGILAAVVLMGGGLLWLTSAGNDTRITQAKELIIGSVSGLGILLCAWILLNTINPALLEMKTINMPAINRAELRCCESETGVSYSTKSQCQPPAKFFEDPNILVNIYTKKCEQAGCCVATIRTGGIPNYECSIGTAGSCEDKWYSQNEFKFVSSQCKDVQECKDRTISSCTGIKDGAACENSVDGYCYHGICWKGLGAQDEPCGNETGSKCSTFTIFGMCPSGYTWDAGGRSCFNHLMCCRPGGKLWGLW